MYHQIMEKDILLVNDIEKIRRVMTLSDIIWHKHYSPIIGVAQVWYMLDKFLSEDAIQKQIDSGFEYYIITSDSIDAGYFSFNLEPDRLFVSKFYTLEEVRGKGIGRLAMDYMEQRAKDSGLKEMYLTVNKNNSVSVAIYKKLGYEVTDEVVTDIGNDFVMDDYVLTKYL